MNPEVPTVMVRMSPELVEQLSEQGWVFGEPDEDGFYEPSVSDSGHPQMPSKKVPR